MSSRLHHHHSLRPFPNNIVHMRRMDGHGKIHYTAERINPHGQIEILKQVGNRYVPSHILGGARHHIQNTPTLMHAKGEGALSHKKLSSKEILDKIYSGFGHPKGIRKL